MGNGIMLLLFAIGYVSSSMFAKGSEVATWPSNEEAREEPKSLFNETDFCLVDEDTIRLKESNVILNITNISGDCITVINSTNSFTITVAENFTYCSLGDASNVNYFVIYVVISLIIIISSSLNIVLHFVVRELRSTPGYLVIGICGTIIITYIAIMILSVFQYLRRVNGDTAICATFKYISTSFAIMYNILKTIYLFHFAFLMYRAYTSHPYQEMNKYLLYIYGIISVTVGAICSAFIIIIDLLQDRIVFGTQNGYCTGHFQNGDEASDYLYNNGVYLTPLLAITTVVGIILFIIGLTLYCLTAKNCCTCSGGTGMNSTRVSITLISVTALGTFILVVLLLSGVDGDGSVIASGIGICVEQVVLLAVFLTSTKSRQKLSKCFQSRKVEHQEEEWHVNPMYHDFDCP